MAPTQDTTSKADAEAAIKNASSIGDLERLAGIGRDDESRYQFWHAFAAIPAAGCLDAGVAELKRRIRAQRV